MPTSCFRSAPVVLALFCVFVSSSCFAKTPSPAAALTVRPQSVAPPPQPGAPNYIGVFSGIVSLEDAGGALFDLARVLQIFPDGRAVLVSSFKGDRFTATNSLMQKYGALLEEVAARQRILHTGTWKVNQNKLDVALETVSGAGGVGVAGNEIGERVRSRLVLEMRERGARLVTVQSSALAYGLEPLRFRRVDVPLPGSLDKATSVRVEKTGDSIEGPVFANIGNKATRIAERGSQTWLVRDGATVLYSVTTGNGGYEGEGQTLFAYEVASRRTRSLLIAPKIIDLVREAKSKTERTVYIVMLTDGAVGIPMTAILDVERGEVYRRDNAKFAGMQNGRAILATYKAGAFDVGDGEKAKPSSSIAVDLDELLPAPPRLPRKQPATSATAFGSTQARTR